MNRVSQLESTLREIAPQASIIDRDPEALRSALHLLASRKLFALRRPQSWGGPEISELEMFRAKILLARTSGALAFLYLQVHSAIGMLASSKNEELLQEFLLHADEGRPLMGIGFGYLRRRGKIPLKAIPLSDGSYRIDGSIPWATGLGFFEYLLVGAELPDETHVLFVLPFSSGNGVQTSEPLALASMEVTNTCALAFDSYRVAPSRVVAVRDPLWLERRDRQKIVEGGAFALGCSERALEILQTVSAKGAADEGRDLHEELLEEYKELLEAASRTLDWTEENRDFPRRLRGRIHEFASRASYAAVVASSGAAALCSHDAQRVYREALAWAVLAQTKEAKIGTLESLLPLRTLVS